VTRHKINWQLERGRGSVEDNASFYFLDWRKGE